MLRVGVLGLLSSVLVFAQAPLRVMLVTGGHDHEPTFYSVFAEQKDIVTNVNPHPMSGSSLERYDVVVLYDMVQELSDARKARLQEFVESGKGLVVLHHALVSHASWPWYRETIGGQYIEKKSTYKHDEDMDIEPVTPHPITRGMTKFRINDETYKGMWISENNTVLLRTTNPNGDPPAAWVSPHAKARVVVIQLGHGSLAHNHPQWRHLVRNAMLWAGGRLK